MQIKNLKIKKTQEPAKEDSWCFLFSKISEIPNDLYKDKIKEQCVTNGGIYVYTENGVVITYIYFKPSTSSNDKEDLRQKGYKLLQILEDYKSKSLYLEVSEGLVDAGYTLLEGLMLSYYKYDKYLSSKYKFSLVNINVWDENMKAGDISKLKNIVTSVHTARWLVDTPLCDMTAVDLPKAFKKYASKTDIKIKVLGKKQIEEKKMGGILAVNRGSETPPTFSIMEYKHPKAKNKQPIVLVGKGIVYDTGGLSLKKTGGSMDRMKSDMSGSAVAYGILLASALNKLPLHIICLVAATDNRPGKNAYVPGDVVKMYDGTTVEVLNTDAEGRMILADCLSYAKEYQPELVFDFATLTGATAAITGSAGMTCMGNADESVKEAVKSAGMDKYERAHELPLWREFYDMMKSSIADLKNIGSSYGGASSAGAFLEHFTDYPWLHFDIAGVSHTKSTLSYRGQGGTGFGIRMVYEFLSQY